MGRRKAPAESEARRSPRQIIREAPGRSPGQMPLVESKYADIYPADVERVEQNYISALPDPDSIYNINAFIGLLFQLHREVIAPALKRPGDRNTGAKGYSIETMNEVFYYVFIPLISKYRITPTIGMFMYLIGIDSSLIDTWKKNSSNSIDIDNSDSNIDIYGSSNNCNLSSRSNKDKYSYYRKWNNYIEQWILGNVTNTGSIGGMFHLKTVYGYTEAQTIRIEAQETRPAVSAAQLDRIAGEAAPKLPEIGQE